MNIISTQSATLPLTTAQRGVWLAHFLDPTGAAYNTAYYTEILGEIDVNLFSQAAGRVVRTTQALCLRLQIIDEAPSFIVANKASWRLELLDFSDQADPLRAAQAWMRKTMWTPFDLHAELFRWTLIKLARDRFIWFHNYHHVTVDGWSGILLGRRVAEAYDALVKGGEQLPTNAALSTHPALAEASYYSFAQWRADRDFWLHALRDRPEMPSLSGKSAVMSKRFTRQSIVLTNDQVARFLTSAAERNTSPARLLIAIAAIYYAGMTGQSDIVLGMPVTARTDREARATPDMRSNTVPLRLRLSLDQTLDVLLDGVHERAKSALRHQLYRIEDLQCDLDVQGAVANLFSFTVNAMLFSGADGFRGVPTNTFILSSGPVSDLSLSLYGDRKANWMHLALDGNNDLYTRDQLETHLARIVHLLDAVTRIPADAPVAVLPLMGAQEQEQVVRGFNATAHDLPAATLPDLFAAQVARTPQACALVFGDEQLTYAELDARSNRLARHLIALGAGPERIVAIALPRSTRMVVAILATLKSGAAYLPLDPETPPARLAFMLADSGASLIMTTGPVLNTIRTGVDQSITASVLAPVVLVDHPALDGILAACSADPIHDADRRAPLRPQNLAYLIYTSGSTGKPKAVGITEQNVTRLLSATDGLFDFGPDDVWTLFHSCAFDVSVSEIIDGEERQTNCGA